MFDRHRQDLKEAHEQSLRAMKDTITVLADQIEYLRAQLDGRAHVVASRPAANPAEQEPATYDSPKFLSEEEEELLALHLNDHINDLDLQELRSELGLTHQIELEPDE